MGPVLREQVGGVWLRRSLWKELCTDLPGAAGRWQRRERAAAHRVLKPVRHLCRAQDSIEQVKISSGTFSLVSGTRWVYLVCTVPVEHVSTMAEPPTHENIVLSKGHGRAISTEWEEKQLLVSLPSYQE